jgi:hypothetical protein
MMIPFAPTPGEHRMGLYGCPQGSPLTDEGYVYEMGNPASY